MYSYSGEFEPPAPVISIDISSPIRPAPVTVLALIDSGSDITVIPRPLAQNLNLQPVYVAYSVSFGGVPEESTIFSALLSIEKEDPSIIEVLTWEENFALLGRDIINQWRIILDGPAQALTISGPGIS